MIILLTLAELLCGSLMFSYYLGRLARKDLSKVGDGNPGAFNLWSAAGYKWGIAGVILDFMKGYAPLVFIISSGLVQGYGVIPLAIAPIVGHAFSPFMKFKGGKAIAVTFGVWSALTSFEISLVYAIILAILLLCFKLLRIDKSRQDDASGLQVVVGMLLVFPYLCFRGFPAYIDWVWLASFALLLITNRSKVYRFFTKKISTERDS